MPKIGTTLTPPTEENDSCDMNNDEEVLELYTLFQPDAECICEFGDVILVVNDGFHPVLKLQVSSCVLAMSSKVFKVLFSKRFSEGQKAEGRCAAAPREIELQDNPTPMRQMCQLLHHQDVKGLDIHAALFEFALVVDKYDCASSARLQADAVLQQQHDSPDQHWEVLNYHQHLLAASALLDQPRHFRHFGHRLIVTSVKLLSAYDFNQRVLDVLPEKVLYSLLHQQNLARQELGVQLGRLIADFRAACKTAGREALMVELIDKLYSRSLLGADAYAQPLDMILHSFESIELPLIALTDRIETPRSFAEGWDGVWSIHGSRPPRRRRVRTGSMTSDTMTADIVYINAPTQMSIKERTAKVNKVCPGVCLDCVKGQACRAHHWLSGEGFGGVLSWDVPNASLELVTSDDESVNDVTRVAGAW